MEFNWKEVMTLVIAVVGAVLGVMNAWRNWSMDRVRLRVRTAVVLERGGVVSAIGVDVVNLSSFPVTISDIGWNAREGRRQSLAFAGAMEGVTLPVRVESRARLTGFVAPTIASKVRPFNELSTVFATTACGTVRAHSVGKGIERYVGVPTTP